MRADVLRGFRSELEKGAFIGALVGTGAKLLGKTALKSAGTAARVGGKAGKYAIKNPMKSLGIGVTGYEGGSVALKGIKNPHSTTLSRYRRTPTKSLY